MAEETEKLWATKVIQCEGHRQDGTPDLLITAM